MNFPPKVTPQLDGSPWGPFNCVFASTAGLEQFSSGGKVADTPDAMRERGGRYVKNPTPGQLKTMGPSNIADAKAALAHPATVKEFAAAGLQPPPFRLLGTVKQSVARVYLQHNVRLIVAINYTVLNRLSPKNSGDHNFNDAPGHPAHHAVEWQGLYGTDGKPWASGRAFTDQIDPLANGRRPGIAKGPQRIPLWLAFAEAEAYAGKGLIYFGVVKPAASIVVPTPPPPPPDPCAMEVMNAVQPVQAALDAAEAEVVRLQGVIRQVAAGLSDVGTSIGDLVAIANDPANTGGD